MSDTPKEGRLKVTEIFYSLQGEARDTGWPTVFIRLTGCPLRCQYCDTAYAFYGGQWLEISEVIRRVKQYPARHLCVTGGEPLAQKACLRLLERLCDEGYIVSLETSGAIDISEVDSRVSRVVDIKTPGSGEAEKNLFENLDVITANDQLKFVICSHDDFNWATEMVKNLNLTEKADVIFSPSKDEVNSTELAGWVLESGLKVRFQLQLHKILWNDEPGR